MSSTRIRCHIDAPRAAVYRALLDPRAVARWKVPDGMTCHVHSFDAREGGSFRISLTYDAPTGTGKTTAHTDTYHGRFVKLVPNEQIVEADEFETADPALRGEMTITITLSDGDGGTDLLAVHDRLPPGVSPADNETGWQMALAKLASLVETRQSDESGAMEALMPLAETPEEMDERLMRVIAQSQFDVLADDYIWQPMSPDQAPAREALACVRDGVAWHQFVLVPASATAS